MNRRLTRILLGAIVLAPWLLLALPHLPAAHAQPRVEYTFMSGYAPSLAPRLSDMAANGWRAISIGMSQDTVIVVLLERQR
jgi:hypothetical protein